MFIAPSHPSTTQFTPSTRSAPLPARCAHSRAPGLALLSLGLCLLMALPLPAQRKPASREARDLASPELKREVDLRVSMPTAGLPQGELQPGQEVQFSVEVTNAGVNAATGSVVQIDVPPGLLGAAWSCVQVPALGTLRLRQTFSNGVDLQAGLQGAADIAFDPSGRTFWVASSIDNALVQFGRQADGETWKVRRILAGSETVVPSMSGASGVWISPDGRSLYLTGSLDNAVSHFELSRGVSSANPDISQNLRLAQVLKQGVDGADGLLGASKIVGGANGRFLYVAAPFSRAITTLARNPEDGQLRYVGSFTAEQAGQECLAGVNSLALSADGQFLYACAYQDNTIVACRRDPATGALSIVQVLRGGGGTPALELEEPYALTLSPDGRHLYVAGFSSDSLLVFTRDEKTGKLEHIQTLQNGEGGVQALDGPGAVATSPDGLEVVVACQFSSTIVEFRRDYLTGNLTPLGFQREGQAAVYGLSGASGLAYSPDGNTVVAAAGESSAVHLFQRLRFLPQPFGAGNVRTRVDLAADSKLVYTVHGQVAPDLTEPLVVKAVFAPGPEATELRPEDNVLTREFAVKVTPPELKTRLVNLPSEVQVGKEFAVEVEVENAGQAPAYQLRLEAEFEAPTVENAQYQPALGWTATITPGAGELRQGTRLLPPPQPSGDGAPAGGAAPRRSSIALQPSAELEQAAEGMSLDPTLTWQGARTVTASPDGRHLYVLCGSPARLVILRRDLGSGQVGPTMVFPPHGDQMSRALLDGITRLVFTPDGDGLFALNPTAGALALFRRNPLEGSLNLTMLWRHTQEHLTTLQGAADMALSADGRNLLIYNSNRAELARIALLPSSPGMVLWQAAPPLLLDLPPLIEGAPPITGAFSPVMALSRDASTLYLSNPRFGGVCAFALPALTEAVPEGPAPRISPVHPPSGAANLLLSPDDRHLYAFEVHSGKMQVFRAGAVGGLEPVPGAGLQLDPRSALDLPYAFGSAGISLLLPGAEGGHGLTHIRRDPLTGRLQNATTTASSSPAPEGPLELLAITAGPRGQDYYTISASDLALTHYRDGRPRLPAAATGPLNTRLDLPPGAKVRVRLLASLSPAFLGKELPLKVSLTSATDAEPPLARDEATLPVARPAQVTMELIANSPRLVPGQAAEFLVKITNQSAAPLPKSRLQVGLKGGTRNVRWQAEPPANSGQWREIGTMPIAGSAAERHGAQALALNLAQDARFLHLLMPGQILRTYALDPETGVPGGVREFSLGAEDADFREFEDVSHREVIGVRDQAQGKMALLAPTAPDGGMEMVDLYSIITQTFPGERPQDWTRALSRDHRRQYALNAERTAIIYSQLSTADYAAAGEGRIETPVVLDPGATLVYRLNGDLASSALGFVYMEATLHLDASAEAAPLAVSNQRWKLEAQSQLEATLEPLGPLRQGEATSFQLRLRNQGPSDAQALWVRPAPLVGWQLMKAKDHQTAPFRIAHIPAGGESVHQVVYSPLESAQIPAETLPGKPLMLPGEQRITIDVAAATEIYPPLAEGEYLAQYTFPRPRMEWDRLGMMRVARLQSVALDGTLRLPANWAGAVHIQLRGPEQWEWQSARFLPLEPGGPAPTTSWQAQLLPPDPNQPGQATVELTRAEGESSAGEEVLHIELAGELRGLGTAESSAPGTLALSAHLEFEDPLYGPSQAPAQPGTLRLEVGQPNLEIAVAGHLPRRLPTPRTTNQEAGGQPRRYQQESIAVPLIIRNRAAEGVAAAEDLEIRPEAPGGWRWVSGHTTSEVLHQEFRHVEGASHGASTKPPSENENQPVTIRIGQLLPGESTVLWLKAQRLETGGEDAAPAPPPPDLVPIQ